MKFSLKSTTSKDVRVRIIPKNHAKVSANVGATNPTSHVDDDGIFSVCLAPSTGLLITCEGATDSVFLEGVDGIWDIELNGTLYVNTQGDPLIVFIRSNSVLASELTTDGDGNTFIKNLNPSRANRLRLIPTDGTRWGVEGSNTNPTVSINSSGVISVCLAPSETIQQIGCEGASSKFVIRGDMDAYYMQMSLNGGAWIPFESVAGYVSVYSYPSNPGLSMVIELASDDPVRVRLRTNREVGLYVNQMTEINEIESNSAYTLYDDNGEVIDPYLESNRDYSGRDFDDVDSGIDYAVFFSEATFCLASDKQVWEYVFDTVWYGDQFVITSEEYELNLSNLRYADIQVEYQLSLRATGTDAEWGNPVTYTTSLDEYIEKWCSEESYLYQVRDMDIQLMHGTRYTVDYLMMGIRFISTTVNFRVVQHNTLE